MSIVCSRRPLARLSIRLSIIALASFLSSCGGGAGNTTDPGSGGFTPHPSIVLNELSLTEAVLPGYSPPLVIDATVNGGAPDGGPVYMVISDPANVIEPASVLTISATTNSPTLTINSALPPQEYRGTILISLCKDLACTGTYANVTLPYDIFLESPSNLTTLTPLAGGRDWQTEGGDDAHDNFVPVTLLPSTFTPRWILSERDPRTYPTGGLDDSAPVTDSAHHIVMAPGNYLLPPALAAYSEVDGKQLWRVLLPGYPGPVALYNGIAYT